MLAPLQDYLDRLSQLRNNPQATGELSLRPALDELFQTLKPAQVDFVGEGKQLASGRPDFTFTRGAYNDPIGYVEAEKVEADLGKLTGHAKTQNERFCADLDNFLLSNHLDFRLYDGGVLVERATLPEKKADLTTKHETDFARLWERFTDAQIAAPQSPTELANLLARRARTLRHAIEESLVFVDSPLQQDLAAFRKLLLPDLTPHDFANLYAETLAYGLFAARCQNPHGDRFSAQTADRALKRTPLLRTLYRLFESEIDKDLEWVLENMAAILNGAAIDEIRSYFSNRSGRPDPMIDFYEPFLAQYDAKARKSRGVYYTPEHIVSYIVRSVHTLLKERFDMEYGVAGGAANSAEILDPATGTGSFLFAVLDAMRDEIGENDWQSFMRDKKPLDHLFGFELMVAPYTIAHLKLALQLEGLGTPLAETERLNIFLTNTLDDARRQTTATLEVAISEEVNAAADVKEKTPIIVVLGNPPYAGHSSNASTKAESFAATKAEGKKRIPTAVGKQIESYKSIDGVPLGERNSKWLQDDYVKFLAFAQKRIEVTGEGIVAFITPHGYFDNPTFRGLRKSFLDTFSTLYLLDLHGNANKKEVAPDGSADQNVFDIKQGVAILLAVKEKGTAGEAEVFHADKWGSRQAKNAALDAEDVTATKWQKLKPHAPMFLFVPRDEKLLPEYEEGWKVTDIFPVNGVGITTARDNVVIDYEVEPLLERAKTFRDSPLSDTKVLQELGIPKKNGWDEHKARAMLKSETDLEQYIKPILYRPFDTRKIFYHDALVWRTVKRIMPHMFLGENLALIFTRQTRDKWDVLSTKTIIAHKALAAYDINSLFPLYLYSDSLFGSEKRPNISEKYLAELAAIVGKEPTPEEVFSYIYAVLHSPIYREKFAAFLKTDFPRVPLPVSLAQFEQYAALGAQLVALHTLDAKAAPVLKEKRHTLSKGSGEVEKPRYELSKRRIWINETQGFDDVDEAIYEFKIGGYTVADKWLADRKGRTLSFEERRLYPQILIALAETRRIMAEIKALETSGA